MNVLDLFSGIGGFSLGLERAGMRTVAFCEIDPYCRAVLRKHWPAVPIFEDVRDLHAVDVGPVDVICGGFPCQDISVAGRGAGITGERSGLWSEYRRLIEECRPSWVIVENVSVLRARGLDQVLGEITALGYDAEWHCIPASAVGAPHQRDRIWIVAYPKGRESREDGKAISGDSERNVSCQAGERRAWGPGGGGSPEVADTDQPRLQGRLREILRQCASERLARSRGASVADTACELLDGGGAIPQQAGRGESSDRGWWLVEPDVGRVANGVPRRVDRLRALGNAVVPQIPEIIGRAIVSEQIKRLRDALAGMVGLVQLVQDRYPDFPVDNHRVIEAMSALAAPYANRETDLEEALRELLAAQAHYNITSDTSVGEKLEEARYRLTDAVMDANALVNR